jgi:hypothetical protein
VSQQPEDKPVLIECGASVSTGGKVQLKKYELSSDYHFHLSGKWAMPPGMTEEDAETFRYEQVLRLRRELEPLAQAEVDDLMEQKSNLEGY